MPKRTRPVVAIDGPAGAGKSTAARKLALHLGFTHIDSGALYRGLAFNALKCEHRLDDGRSLAALARYTRMEFRELRLYIDEVDRSSHIRRPEIGRLVPQVAAHPEVREAIDDRLRKMGELGGVIVDGRDIGTSVFPDAEVKVFLTASLERRAERHHLDLGTRGVVMNLDQVIDDLRQRDHEDSTRAVSPLRQADDAEVLDTTNLDPEEVLAALIRLVREGSPTSQFPLPVPRS